MQVFKYLSLALTLLCLMACSDTDYGLVIGTVEKETIIEYVDVEPDIEIWVDSFTQIGAFDEMDILWVIDGSCSMNSHHSQLVLGVEAMMNNLPLDINWRLKMITAGDYAYITQSNLFPLTRGDDIDDAIYMLNDLPYDGGESGFSAVQNYVNDDAYAKTWMRPDAALLTVFVSDEPEQSSTLGANDFVWWYENQRDSVFLASIVHVPAAESVCTTMSPGITHIGQEYIEATNYLGGAVVDICNPDWATAVEDATQEIEPFEDYKLKHIPYENTIAVFVETKPFLDWHYDATDNRIYFDTMPAEGELVEMAYAVKEYSWIDDHSVEMTAENLQNNNLSP
jgi:hypothetical protein